MTATFELYRDDLQPLVLQYLRDRLKVEINTDDIELIDAEVDDDGNFDCLTVCIATDS